MQGRGIEIRGKTCWRGRLHEIDHLNGFFSCNTSDAERDLIKGKSRSSGNRASGKCERMRIVFCGTPQFAVPTLNIFSHKMSLKSLR